jgi:membrane protease YdiL (CAAX protease family)
MLSFYIMAYSISWLCWSPLCWGYFDRGWHAADSDVLATAFVFLGSFGPALSAIVVAYLTRESGGLKALLRRFTLWRVPVPVWLLAVFVWVPIISAAGAVFDAGSPGSLLSGLLGVVLNLPVFILFIGPAGEELGWRGFALERLLARHNALLASLVVGVLWAFWHTPLALFLDGWRGGVPLLAFGVNYVVLLAGLSVVFTWFYRRSKGSVLLCMILHAAYNYGAGPFLLSFGLDQDLRPAVNWAVTALILFFAAVITALYGKNLDNPLWHRSRKG